MRVLISGSRQWTEIETIEAFVSLLHPETIIIEGGAAGVDRLAEQAARKFGLAVEEFTADWKQYNRAAGPIRNQAMLDSKPDVVVAFSLTPITPGTADMIARARKAGVPVLVIHSFGSSR